MKRVLLLFAILILTISAVYADQENIDPIGCIDYFTYTSGKLFVHGWACDQNHTEEKIEVQVYCDEQYLGSGITEYLRNDVNSAFSLTNEHGYVIKLDVELDKIDTVSIYGVDLDTNEKVFLDSKEFSMEKYNQDVIGNLEVLTYQDGQLQYKGWAYDPNASSSEVTIKLYIDEQQYYTMSTFKEREDVNKINNIEGNHGFNKTINLELDGIHQVSVYAIDINSQSEILLGSKDINFGGENTLPFVDVDENKWYYDYVSKIYERGIMTGIDQSHFSPNGYMTRGMVTTVLYRMSGSPNINYESYFDDVLDGKYYSKAITWCYQNGIIQGNGDGTFSPSNMITRQELAIMLRNYVSYCKIDPFYYNCIDSFPDSSNVSSWAKKSMNWAVANRLISGDQGYLNPRSFATRAQCAKMLLAVIDLIDIMQNKLEVNYEIDNLSVFQDSIYVEGRAKCNIENYRVELYVNNQYIQDLTLIDGEFNENIKIDNTIINQIDLIIAEDLYCTKTHIAQLTASRDYKYCIDVLRLEQNTLYVSGWIVNLDNLENQSHIIIKVDDEVVIDKMMDVLRTDVNDFYAIEGNHGFNYEISLEEDKEIIEIFIVDDFGNERLINKTQLHP